MEKNPEFNDIRPYYDDEVSAVIDRLLKDPLFKGFVDSSPLSGIEWESLKTAMGAFTNKYDFQHTLIKELVGKIISQTADSIHSEGFENISGNKAYTYISNHRDIILDASILSVTLAVEGFDTAEIAIGDNLLLYPWIEDLVRLNKSFIVKRNLSFRQILESSKHLSRYIHFTVRDKKQSVWIAQREGRAKNSNDQTQESVLKMLVLGGEKENFLENLEELNITPVSFSYEYDPCDYLKAKEFQQKRDNPDFKKSQQDDLINMKTGLLGYKGRIYFRIGRTINPALKQIDPASDKNELMTQTASLIDNEIFRNYRFYPVNYIAYDRLWGNGIFREKYSDGEEQAFDSYLQRQLSKIDLPDKDLPFLTEKLLEMYAYPVKNQLSVKAV